jgi:ABC-2 type transport system ATP-binding protein
MSNEAVIQTHHLTKYYGKTRGIENLDLEIYKGEIFGLLGPNGAGKTTTIRILLDLIRCTSGEAKLFNLDVHQFSKEIRQRIAYIPGELGLFQDKSAKRNIEFLLGLYNNHIPKNRILELAEILNLDIDKKVKELSKGNKQKVGIILGLAPSAELLILDEPTSGLDPLITAEFYNILRTQQKETEATILLSSHLLGEVERIADRVGIIREGAIVELATISQLKKMAMKEIRIEFSNPEEIKKFSSQLSSDIVESITLNDKHANFMINRAGISKILHNLSHTDFIDVDISSPALEDIFLKYYKQTSDNANLNKYFIKKAEGVQ